MPTRPDIQKGEGFTRTSELLEAMQDDIHTAYETLEADRESQYLRRCVVRSVFSYIESMIECVKAEIKSTIRTGQYLGALTEKEMEVIGTLAIVNGDSGRPMPIDDNIRKTFKIAGKVWDLDFKLDTRGNDFTTFKIAKASRNRLVHPRTYYDIQVTDDDMADHTIAGMWAQKEFHRLMKARVDAVMARVSGKQKAFLEEMRNIGGLRET